MTLSDYLAIVILWVSAVAIPFYMAKVGEPKLVPGENLTPFPESELQARYDRKFGPRMATKALLLLLYGVMIVGVVTDPPRHRDLDVTPLYMAGGFYVASLLIAHYLRYRRDATLVASSPALNGSLSSLSIRMGSVILSTISLGLVAFGFQQEFQHDDFLMSAVSLAVAMIPLIISRRLVLGYLVKKQITVPPDSAFAQKIATIQERFGVTPKRIAVVPMTMPNAFAMPDGSVLITAMCRAIMTDDEVCAILAHELSHIKDRDAVKLQRGRAAVMILCGLLSGVVAVLCVLETNTPPITLIALVMLGMYFFNNVIGLWLAKYSRRLEYKCDKAAKDIGYGDEIALGLVKLHQVLGASQRWNWPDTVQLSHPSLEKRLDALRQA